MWRDFVETDWDNWSFDEDNNWNWDDKTENIVVKDSNWNILTEWDTVSAIKDLKVKWMKDIKRWDKFSKIRFTEDPLIIESWKMVLKTEFFKKI